MKKVIYLGSLSILVLFGFLSCNKETIYTKTSTDSTDRVEVNKKSNTFNSSFDFAGQIHNIVLSRIDNDRGYQNSNLQGKARRVIKLVEDEFKDRNIPIVRDGDDLSNVNHVTHLQSKGVDKLVGTFDNIIDKVSDAEETITFYNESVGELKAVLSKTQSVKIGSEFDNYMNDIFVIINSDEFDSKQALLSEFKRVGKEIQNDQGIKDVLKEPLLGSISIAYHSSDFWIDSDEDIIDPECGWCKKVFADVGGFLGGFGAVLGVNEIFDESWNPFAFGVTMGTAASDAV